MIEELNPPADDRITIEDRGGDSHDVRLDMSGEGGPILEVRNTPTSRVAATQILLQGVSNAVPPDVLLEGGSIALTGRETGGQPIRLALKFASKPGFFGKLAGKKPTVVVTDGAGAGMVFPHLACSVVALERARQSGVPPVMKLILERSLEAFPGTPGKPAPPGGVPYNWENARTYLELVPFVGFAEGAELIRKAAERAPDVAFETLGGSLDEIAAVKESVVRRVIGEQLEWFADAPNSIDELDGVRIAPSPVLMPAEERKRFVSRVTPELIERYWNENSVDVEGWSEPIFDIFWSLRGTPEWITVCSRLSAVVFRKLALLAQRSDTPFTPCDLLVSHIIAQFVRYSFHADVDAAVRSFGPDVESDDELQKIARDAMQSDMEAAAATGVELAQPAPIQLSDSTFALFE